MQTYELLTQEQREAVMQQYLLRGFSHGKNDPAALAYLSESYAAQGNTIRAFDYLLRAIQRGFRVSDAVYHSCAAEFRSLSKEKLAADAEGTISVAQTFSHSDRGRAVLLLRVVADSENDPHGVAALLLADLLSTDRDQQEACAYYYDLAARRGNPDLIDF